jgi:Flp pilus assembly protein CpaB
MASHTLTPERALRRPWRFDRRLLLSLLVTLAAIGGMFAYAGSLAATRPVVVATHDLPAGAILGRDDLTIAQVRVDATIYAAAVPGDVLAQVVGQQLAEPVHRQQILARAQLSSRARLASGELALTIPITAASAVD